MGAIFANAPITPTCVGVQVGKIDLLRRDLPILPRPARYHEHIRPVDSIGRPMGDLNVGTQHTELLVARAKAKNLEISLWDGDGQVRDGHQTATAETSIKSAT
jgi:hypothetical protein